MVYMGPVGAPMPQHGSLDLGSILGVSLTNGQISVKIRNNGSIYHGIWIHSGILLVQSEGNAPSIHMHQSARSYPTGNARWTSWRALLLWR